MERRWRGTIDVPLTDEGLWQADRLRDRIGTLDLIYHDGLSRCRDTATVLAPNAMAESDGPRPWNMGQLFEGREITPDSLHLASHYVKNRFAVPPGGEPFAVWADHWWNWLREVDAEDRTVGIVTHNRSIQHAIAMNSGVFDYQAYDCDGPDFCTAWHHKDGRTAEWLGGEPPPGTVLLLRHGQTEWGT